MTLSTDIIVGFPGENEADFQATLDLLSQVKPSFCNRTRFVARPGTPAAQLSSKVPAMIMRQRTSRLHSHFLRLAQESHSDYLGWIGEVELLEPGKEDTWFARNHSYRPMVVRPPFFTPPAPGKIMQVQVVEVESFALFCNPLQAH